MAENENNANDFLNPVEPEQNTVKHVVDMKLTREQTRRQRILGALRATDGWSFIGYVKFINGKGRCQVSGVRLVNGIEIFNPWIGVRGLTLIVSKRIVLDWTNLGLGDLPRRSKRNTKIIDLGDRRVQQVWPDISKPISAERLNELAKLEDTRQGHFAVETKEQWHSWR